MPSSQPYNENDLLFRIAEGDEHAFRCLFDWYTPKLRPYLWKSTGSDEDTEDILQETFIKIWMNRDKLAYMENVGGYIYRIAARTCLNYMRSALNQHKKMSELGLLSSSVGAHWDNLSPLSVLQANLLQDLIKSAVAKLSSQQQKIYSLNRDEGLKPAAIATLLNLSVSTVKNHLSDALKQIRAHIILSGYDINVVILALMLFF